jgi:homeobox protein cut-like
MIYSVKTLEMRISEHEAESERLSLALELQKQETSQIEATTNKRMEDISRETQKKVGFLSSFTELLFS